MGFWGIAAIWLGSVVFGALFRPKQRRAATRVQEPQDFRFPQTGEGLPYPVVFGTAKVRTPLLAWAGDKETSPILDQGVVVGYRYYAGMHLDICTGPIDELVSVDVNDKAIGAGVNAANNGIRFGFGAGPYVTAAIATGSYESGADLAAACEDAMIAALAGNWKVTYGFTIQAGVNDALWVGVNGGAASKVTLTPGIYSGTTLAAHIRSKAGATNFNCTYDGTTGKFHFTGLAGGGFPSAPTFQFYGIGHGSFSVADTALSTLGIRGDVTKNTPFFSEHAVYQNRVIFALVGGTTGTLKLTAPEFTSAALLGFSTAADATLMVRTGDFEATFVSGEYFDLGTHIRVQVNDASFFGVDEGGLEGTMDVFKGALDQPASDYLTEQLGDIPAFRGIAYAVVRKMYLGNNAYPKPFSFVVRRCPNTLGLTGGKQNINGDANPANIIYEALTNDLWGAAIPVGHINWDSLFQMGNTLYDEGLGLSGILSEGTSAVDLVDDILRHVDGFRYDDPNTGKISFGLARANYVVGNLATLTPDNVTRCRITRPSWDDLRNVVRIRYTSRAEGYVEKVEQLMDPSNIAIRGTPDLEEVSLPWITTSANARKAGDRMLKAMGYPMAQLELGLTRVWWALRPGSIAKLTWPPLGITDMPVRITTIESGTLTDGELEADAVEDIFGVS